MAMAPLPPPSFSSLAVLMVVVGFLVQFSSWLGLQRSSELITTQSYTVGLLGVPGASSPPPPPILAFPRSFFVQPSPLGVVAAAAPKGESGAPLAGDGDDGAELDSLRGDVTTDSAAGRRSMVKLRVTAPGGGAEPAAAAAATAADDDDEGEKEAYLRSLPRPESGRGPATVSSHSWFRSPIYAPVRARPTYVRSGRPATAWCAFCFESDALALFPLVLLFDVFVVLGARGREA